MVASDDQAGKPVVLKEKGKQVAEGRLAPDESGRVKLQVSLPARYGQTHSDIDVLVDGLPVDTVKVSNIDRDRLEALVYATPVDRPSVFFGSFLEVDFEADLVRRRHDPFRQ